MLSARCTDQPQPWAIAPALFTGLGGPVLLTSGSGSSAGWPAKQEALAALSTDSVHRVVEGIDHAGLIADGEGAAATVRAVLDVLSSVRGARPLTS